MMTAETNPASTAGAWTGTRLGVVIGVLFVAQLFLLLLASHQPHGAEAHRRSGISFQTLLRPLDQSQAAQSFFAADPVVFSSASPHGFSGRAWIIFSPREYRTPQQLEPPLGLALNVERLAGKLSSSQPASLVPFELVEQLGPQLEPLPVLGEQTARRTHSTYFIQGPASEWPMSGPQPLPLRAWASPQLLTNSVVEFALDRSGLVVATRLLGSCGLREADLEGLKVVSQFHFNPCASVPGLVWSRAFFQWQTVEAAPKH